MSEFTKGILVGLIPALLVSVISAYLTTRLALNKFYSEKWWEKKAEAYSDILGKLSDMHLCIEKWADEELGTVRWTEKYKEELSRDYSQAKKTVAKAVTMGSFIISEEAATTLTKLEKELNRLDLNNYGDLEDARKAITNCIEKLREDAKRNLRKR
jgi:ribosomal protein S17E